MPQYLLPISDTMRENVAAILANEASDAPKQASLNITKRPAFGSYHITCIFHGNNRVTGKQFELEPLMVEKIEFKQDFKNNYTDEITLVVSIPAVSYLQLFDDSAGLKCTLRFTPCSLEYIQFDDDDSWVREYLVVFKDKTDIRKKYGKQALIADNEQTKGIEQQNAMLPNIEFQLIDQTAYNLRKLRFNFQARQATMRDVILYICRMCSIPKIAMVEPNNTTKYNNLVIPPLMTFDNAMTFLQNHYGVYDKGLSYYYTEDVLYVYPPYEVEPTTPESVHLYYVGNNYTGLKVCHAYASDITHIIITDFVKTQELVDAGVERIGTDVIIQDAGRIIDRQSIITEAPHAKGTVGLGTVHLNEVNTTVYSPTDRQIGMTFDNYQLMFQFDNSNPYIVRSGINSYRRSLVGIDWHAAQPFTFKPGYKVYYHYDSEDVTTKDQDTNVDTSYMYTTKTGICEAVTYTYKMAGRIDKEHIYTCNAKLVLSIQYTPVNEKPEAETVSNLNTARGTKEVSLGGTNTPSLINIRQTSNQSATSSTPKRAKLF